MRILICFITIIGVLGSSLACGQAAPPAPDLTALDTVVARLPDGLSSDEVEEQLGTPRARFETEHGEIVMIYGSWHVVLHPSLYKRTRYYPAGYRPGQPVALLDRKVGALKLGLGRRTVERELGKTEAWEILSFGSNERLWYGNGRWELHFADRRLSGKVLYR